MRYLPSLLAGLLLAAPAQGGEQPAPPPPAAAPAAVAAPATTPEPASQAPVPRGAEALAAAPAPSAAPGGATATGGELGAKDTGFPFPGAVIGTDVNLRAGASTSYEVVARLGDGTRLQVVSESYGWYGVQAPAAETSVFVHEDLLRRLPSGAAMIAHDRVNLRARPNLQASVVGQSRRGDLVEVRDSKDGWVRIAPPTRVTFYIHRDFVRRLVAGAQVAAAPGGHLPPAADATDLLIEARDLYLAELERHNLDQMDFGRALKTYQRALELAGRPDVEGAARAGIRQIEIAIGLQKAYRKRAAALGEARPEPTDDASAR